ncbi:hypothetical protein CYLTODRAFT_97821 [Cylindrobasidium torrendii FP15055 ss-10]|uniref:Uncharacterized protein n=1 Tax=Cylindrobasidium torrendii FP15055 ss-10 TaxID=1314674 RepID=A0A0D7BML3_9AGAR|nr:hypothetical protein CYLTODRAFT_97821 [Cylindrobasidium torrendii FP15055 ss-10]
MLSRREVTTATFTRHGRFALCISRDFTVETSWACAPRYQGTYLCSKIFWNSSWGPPLESNRLQRTQRPAYQVRPIETRAMPFVDLGTLLTTSTLDATMVAKEETHSSMLMPGVTVSKGNHSYIVSEPIFQLEYSVMMSTSNVLLTQPPSRSAVFDFFS